VVAHEGVRARILGTDLAAHVARVASFGPEEPKLLEGYRPNAPVITFQSEMKLHVGDHTFRLVHMPGHTAYQAAVIVEEEGVVFTSDNIFCKVHTWLQEADPNLWLEALESLRGLREDMFVPGHGPVCDKRYLDEQGAFIREWVDYVRRRGVERGMTKERCVAELTAMTDRYPMDVSLRQPVDPPGRIAPYQPVGPPGAGRSGNPWRCSMPLMRFSGQPARCLGIPGGGRRPPARGRGPSASAP